MDVIMMLSQEKSWKFVQLLSIRRWEVQLHYGICSSWPTKLYLSYVKLSIERQVSTGCVNLTLAFRKKKGILVGKAKKSVQFTKLPGAIV